MRTACAFRERHSRDSFPSAAEELPSVDEARDRRCSMDRGRGARPHAKPIGRTPTRQLEADDVTL